MSAKFIKISSVFLVFILVLLGTSRLFNQFSPEVLGCSVCPTECPWPSWPPCPGCSPCPSWPPCQSPSPSPSISPSPSPSPSCSPSPSPSPSVSPSPSPSPSFSPSPSPSVSPSPSPSPSPSVRPSPSPSPKASEAPRGGPGPEPGPSVCNATTPSAPILLSVSKSGDCADLTWTAVDLATHYSIAYGESSGDYKYGVDNTGKVTAYTVCGLDPATNYCFAVRAVNDCAPSDLSNEICTGQVLGAATGQVLGATTLGDTGDLTDELLQILFIIGSGCLSLGLKIFSPVKKEV